MDINLDVFYKDIATKLHKYISEVNLQLMPYNCCSQYNTCNECIFGVKMYKECGIDLKICDVLLRLDFALENNINIFNERERNENKL
jgi:hypothetical protein